jgi:ATP-binding protein involved in chromosome partitioning
MSVTKELVIDRLRTVNDPELHRDLVTLNMVKAVQLCEGMVTIKVELTTPACPMKEVIERDIKAAVGAISGVTQVNVEFTADVKKPATPQAQAAQNNPLPGVKHIIAVGAGKGGVGKSTVAVNLAVGLARSGASVGVLDGDIYGPSLPTLLGLTGQSLTASGNNIAPFFTHGVKAMTIGAMVEPDRPLIWRGPMAHGAFRDLAMRTVWDELDYLIIDLPPGTGDVPLTMSQTLPLTGAVVVCTPQKVAQDDARRALRMFQQLNIEVLGVVENMSYFIGDDGKEYDIFGRGGAQVMAQEMGVPFLGAVPINMNLRANSDGGDPTANFTGGRNLADPLEAMVRNVAGQISIVSLSGHSAAPSLSVS